MHTNTEEGFIAVIKVDSLLVFNAAEKSCEPNAQHLRSVIAFISHEFDSAMNEKRFHFWTEICV